MTLKELLLNYSPAINEEIIAYYNDSQCTRNVVFKTTGDYECKYFDDVLASEYKYTDVVFFYHENNKLMINLLIKK